MMYVIALPHFFLIVNKAVNITGFRVCIFNNYEVYFVLSNRNFFSGCYNTGQLSKVLQVTLLPFEEEVFIKYLKDCNEPQTSDILVMYYLQQAR